MGVIGLSIHEIITWLMSHFIIEKPYFQVLQDKKLKGQLSVREDLYGKSAKAAAKAEKVNSCSM